MGGSSKTMALEDTPCWIKTRELKESSGFLEGILDHPATSHAQEHDQK
jgi:hypothetical protein